MFKIIFCEAPLLSIWLAVAIHLLKKGDILAANGTLMMIWASVYVFYRIYRKCKEIKNTEVRPLVPILEEETY